MNNTIEFLSSQRYVGDPEADDLVSYIMENQWQSQLYQLLSTPVERMDKLDDFHVKLTTFMRSRKADPDWLDPQLIKKGQLFYRKYASEIMMLLGAMSLPYCYAASPGNKAIFMTEKMRQKPGKRLLETAQYVIKLMEDNSFESGSAYLFINKTRLVHAMVRYMLLHKAHWDLKWGMPINQEDMAGTNLAFSFTIINGLKKQEFLLPDDQVKAFMHTWRYIGFQMDIHPDLLVDDLNEAGDLEEIIRKRHFKASEEGKQLMQDLLKHYRDEFPWLAGKLIENQIRYFLGEEISDMLGLRKEPGKDKLVAMVNSVKNKLNKHLHVSTYQTMLKNHERLKQIHG